MRSQRLGKSTSKAEVQGISPKGIWLLVNDSEYFLSYSEFPWFKNAKVSEVFNLRFLNGYHLHWSDLDVDLELESLQHLEKYPLVYLER